MGGRHQERHATGAQMRLHDVAAAVEGLLSDFSDHMTGLDVLHDGGFT
jgi:hypothetical protein